MERGDAEIEHLIQLTLDTGMQIHRDIGPGLMESVYENLLKGRLEDRGIKTDRQQPVNLHIDNRVYNNAFRYNLLLEKNY